jgi:tetratricopeptide (TPR) repeat protein
VKSIQIQGFISPDKLFLDEPRGIRAIALEKLARDLHLLFGEKMNEITENIMRVYKIERLEATIKSHYYYQQARSIYADEANQLMKPLIEKLQDALALEKSGQLNAAIQLLEELMKDAHPASMPYERLRIIYTKQKEYQRAVLVCKRYIEVLEKIQPFWNEFPNLKLIPKYRQHIANLRSKIK